MINSIKSVMKLKIGSFLIILITVLGCSVLENESTISFRKTGESLGQIKQNKSDQLAGVTNAISYSGFRNGQHPDRGDGAVNPSYVETLEDLNILSRNSNYKLIRLYDAGENSQTVLKVINENNINIKVLLGIWLKAEISNHAGCPWLTEPIPEEVLAENKKINSNEINTAIKLAQEYPKIIVAINVGNEALIEWNDHLIDTDSMITYVKRVKNNVSQPVTIADNFRWWVENGLELSKVVDFVAIHIYPLWEGQGIETAMEYSIENVEEVCKALPESKIVITEAGWATIATEFGDRASEANQEKYYNDLMKWADQMNVTTFFFEAFDEPWKGNPDDLFGAEKHWGIFNVDRTPKKVMKSLYPDL